MLLLALSIAAAVLNTIAGGGQGILLVPALILLFSFSPSSAVGTNFLAGVAGSLSSMLSYSRERVVDYKVGTALGVAAIPGVMIGSIATNEVPATLFDPVLGSVVIALAMLLFLGPELQKNSARGGVGQKIMEEEKAHGINWRLAVPLVFLMGVFAGAFGSGGGLILTPILLFAGLPIFYAVGTNRLAAVIYVTAGVFFKSYLGQVSLDFGLWLVIGAAVGGVIGARIVKLQKSSTLKKLVAFLISILGLFLILQIFL